MIGGATATTSGGGRGNRRRTRGYARTVAQKREARRARRARGVATIIGGGRGDDNGARRRNRHRVESCDRGVEVDDDDDEVLEEADDVENASGEETRVDAGDDNDDHADYDEAGNDVVDSRLDDRDVVDDDVLRGDTATNDDVVRDESDVDNDESSSCGDESFDIALDERKTRASRSSYKKKRRVIRDDDDDDDNDDDGSSREEDGHVESASSIRGIAETTATRSASDRYDSPTRDARMRDERDDGDSERCGRGKRRWGRWCDIAETTGRDRMSVDDDSERELVVDSMMAPVDRRYVSASASDKKGGRCKTLRRTEMVENGGCFPSSLGDDGSLCITILSFLGYCLTTIVFVIGSLLHLAIQSQGQNRQHRRLGIRRRLGTPRCTGKSPICSSQRKREHQCLR